MEKLEFSPKEYLLMILFAYPAAALFVIHYLLIRYEILHLPK